MSAKQSIKEQLEKQLQEYKTQLGDDAQDGDDGLDLTEYSRLVLDDSQIQNINEDDKKYLENFNNLAYLSMNKSYLTSLKNLPKVPKLERLEVGDNQLKGEELKHLSVYKDTLQILKIGNNKIASINDLDALKDFEHLIKVDFEANPFATENPEEYRKKVFEKLPGVQILDGKDREGESQYTDDDDYGEEGELDLEDDFAASILAKLDPETRERFEKGEMDQEEMQNLGLMAGFDDYGEEGEVELEDYNSEGSKGGDDKSSDEEGEAPKKVQKTD